MSDLVTIPKSLLRKLERFVDQYQSDRIEWLNEKQACELLNIKHTTLSNYISSGLMKREYFTIGFNGKRFYDKAKLLGLKK